MKSCSERHVLDITLRWHPSGQLAENQRRGLEWHAYSRLLSRERDVAYGLLLEALQEKRPHFKCCTLRTMWSFKRKGRAPDFENLVAREKPLVDCLVSIGVITDDNWENIFGREMLPPLMGQEENSLKLWVEGELA